MEAVRAIIVRDPEITQAEFASEVALLRREDDAILNVAAAPGLVVSLVYPLEGNEPVVGLDYNTSESFGPAVREAVASGVGTISGPVALVQGGTGMIMRQPVYLADEKTGARDLWGVIAVVLDYNKFMASVGLEEAADQYDISILSYGIDRGVPAVRMRPARQRMRGLRWTVSKRST
jgi:sensor domain CHASE-containing protein